MLVRLAPKADKGAAISVGPLCAKTGLMHRSNDVAIARLFDHLIGAGEHNCRDLDAERLGGLEVNDQLVLGRRLHRQVGWFLALEEAIDVGGGLRVLSMKSGPYETNRPAATKKRSI
jgi:hypothetical protein